MKQRKQEPRSTSGLTDPDRRKLEIALKRLEALSGHGAFGWSERNAVAEVAKGIKTRLDPPSVEKLLADADRLCSPLENTLRDYQAWAEAQAVLG